MKIVINWKRSQMAYGTTHVASLNARCANWKEIVHVNTEREHVLIVIVIGRRAHKTRITSWIPTQSRWLHLHNAPTYSTNVCGSFENLIRFCVLCPLRPMWCTFFRFSHKWRWPQNTLNPTSTDVIIITTTRSHRWTLFTDYFFLLFLSSASPQLCIFLYYVIWNCFEPSFAVIANCIVAHNRIDCTKCNIRNLFQFHIAIEVVLVLLLMRWHCIRGFSRRLRRMVRCSTVLILLFSYSFALFLHYCHSPGRLLDRLTTYPFAR